MISTGGDSGLEAFNHYLTDGSLATIAAQLIAVPNI